MRRLLPLLALLLSATAHAQTDWRAQAKVEDFVLEDFRFHSGQTMDLRMRVTTLGTPQRDGEGRITNAVMVLHGTGGTGAQFFRPQFADELYSPGQPFDLAKTYVILPDNLGHGGSAKPSDGLRMAFPRYTYADMVAAQKRMLEEGLGIGSLRLILGTSMGCMHAFVWGESYPGFAQRLAPFACNAIPIAGRNRVWRKMAIDTIQRDPAWRGGAYAANPELAMRHVADLLLMAGSSPLAWQTAYPTREAAESFLAASRPAATALPDANDTIYQIDASRDYDPSPLLERIRVPVLWINSADDFINPPELGGAETLAKRMPGARFILIPASPETRGHGTHTWAQFWKDDLAKLLAQPAGRP